MMALASNVTEETIPYGINIKLKMDHNPISHYCTKHLCFKVTPKLLLHIICAPSDVDILARMDIILLANFNQINRLDHNPDYPHDPQTFRIFYQSNLSLLGVHLMIVSVRW